MWHSYTKFTSREEEKALELDSQLERKQPNKEKTRNQEAGSKEAKEA